MKKTYQYNKIEKMLTISIPFNNAHIQTLTQINENDGVAEFDNRDPNLFEDVDGNSISWRICDDLVIMGLLMEDEEAHDIFYEITNDGVELLKQLK